MAHPFPVNPQTSQLGEQHIAVGGVGQEAQGVGSIILFVAVVADTRMEKVCVVISVDKCRDF